MIGGVKKVKQLADRAEHMAESVENAAEAVKNTAFAIPLVRLIGKVVKVAQKRSKKG